MIRQKKRLLKNHGHSDVAYVMWIQKSMVIMMGEFQIGGHINQWIRL